MWAYDKRRDGNESRELVMSTIKHSLSVSDLARDCNESRDLPGLFLFACLSSGMRPNPVFWEPTWLLIVARSCLLPIQFEDEPLVLAVDRPEVLQISTGFAKGHYTFERFFLS